MTTMERKTISRRAALAATGAAATPFILPSGAFAQAAGPIRIAGLVSLTGGGSPFGPSMRAVHQAVVDEVNAAGGVLGRRIEYLSEDDQTNPDAGVRATRKLIDVDKVSAAMGGQTFKAPSGITSTMDAKNHHLHKAVFIGEVKADGQFNVVWKTKGPVKAQPWSPFIAGNDKKKDEPALMAEKKK